MRVMFDCGVRARLPYPVSRIRAAARTLSLCRALITVGDHAGRQQRSCDVCHGREPWSWLPTRRQFGLQSPLFASPATPCVRMYARVYPCKSANAGEGRGARGLVCEPCPATACARVTGERGMIPTIMPQALSQRTRIPNEMSTRMQPPPRAHIHLHADS